MARRKQKKYEISEVDLGKAIKELVKLREEYERIESQNKNFKTKLDRANKTIKKLNNNKNNVDDDESIE
jgi:chromosome segregation ATPase